MECCGFLGTGAQWRELPEKYPPYQTCHRRFQQWVGSGKLEPYSAAVGRASLDERQVEVGRGLCRCRVCGGEKGVSRSARPVGARAQRFSLSPLITVFHSRQSASPHESQLVEEGLAGSFLDELPARLIATEHTTQMHSTKGSNRNMTSS